MGEVRARTSGGIRSLCSGTVSALDWSRTLVPFVASVLVRGIDFNNRFEARLPENLESLNKPDNTNQARLLELQRLLGLVAAASWNILRVRKPGEVVVGDVGFAPAQSAVTGNPAIAIPLDRWHVLLLEPQRTRHILTLKDNVWQPVLNYADLSEDGHVGFSRTIALYARRFVFGSSEQIVTRYLSDAAESAPEVPEPWAFGFVSSRLARFHEFTWHRLVSFLERAPSDPPEDPFALAWDALARGWCPPVFFPSNLPEFASSLALIGPDVVVHFFDVPDQVLDAMMQGVAPSSGTGTEDGLQMKEDNVSDAETTAG